MKYIEINARNVLFTKETEDLFSEMQERAQNQFVKKYISSNLRKYYINDWKPENVRFMKPITKVKESSPQWLKNAIKKEKVYEIHLNPSLFRNKLLHLVDYLNTLPPRPISIPVKELKDRIKLWDKKLKDDKNKKEGLNIEEDGIKVIYTYPNKYRWVKVFGKDSLNREGRLMNHCVEKYYTEVKNNRCEIYSLRDNKNIPHVTIEYRKNVIIQIKGNSNQPPKDEYIKYVNDLLKKKYINYVDVEQTDLIRCGLVYQDNQVHKLELLPSGFVIKSDLFLDDLDKDIKLPEGLIINGLLSIDNSAITKLPERLTVKRSFFATDSALKYVPKSCSFKTNINISKSCVEKWEISEIKGDFLASESDLTYLPDNFIVHGNCILAETNISYIENITVDGDLDLSGCKHLDSESIGFINVKKTLYLPSNFLYVYGKKIVAGNIIGGREIELEYDEYDEEEDE